MNEQLSILEIIVIAVCVLGVGAFFALLFHKDKCSFGGTHNWWIVSDYQLLEVHECSKCKETKSVDKIKI